MISKVPINSLFSFIYVKHLSSGNATISPQEYVSMNSDNVYRMPSSGQMFNKWQW